jgi:hypothetical protein
LLAKLLYTSCHGQFAFDGLFARGHFAFHVFHGKRRLTNRAGQHVEVFRCWFRESSESI